MRGVWSVGGELVSSAGVRWRAADCATAPWARAVRDMRLWAGVDDLVVSGPNRHRVVLCSGPARLHFVILMIFTHPNLEIRNGDIPDVQNSPNF
jgi:hypothetical protein